MPKRHIIPEVEALSVLDKLDKQILQYFKSPKKAGGNTVRIMSDVQEFIRAAKQELRDYEFD